MGPEARLGLPGSEPRTLAAPHARRHSRPADDLAHDLLPDQAIAPGRNLSAISGGGVANGGTIFLAGCNAPGLLSCSLSATYLDTAHLGERPQRSSSVAVNG